MSTGSSDHCNLGASYVIRKVGLPIPMRSLHFHLGMLACSVISFRVLFRMTRLHSVIDYSVTPVFLFTREVEMFFVGLL